VVGQLVCANAEGGCTASCSGKVRSGLAELTGKIVTFGAARFSDNPGPPALPARPRAHRRPNSAEGGIAETHAPTRTAEMTWEAQGGREPLLLATVSPLPALPNVTSPSITVEGAAAMDFWVTEALGPPRSTTSKRSAGASSR
jgi:hypothetical protein